MSMKDFIFKLDKNVAEVFHKFYLWGGDFSNALMKTISYIAEAGILFLIIGLGLAFFKRTRKVGGVVLLSVAIGFVITNLILKNSIGRLRPFESSDQYWLWWLDAGSVVESGYSFPSGHTTATMAFALAIFLTVNKKYSWPILLFPIVMASSRMYLMVHYFSDCVGGIVVGCASAVIAYLIVKWIYKSKLKFCVWVREFNVFGKTKAKASVTSSQPNVQSVETAKEKEYQTQIEEAEQTERQTLIRRDITSRGDDETETADIQDKN